MAKIRRGRGRALQARRAARSWAARWPSIPAWCDRTTTSGRLHRGCCRSPKMIDPANVREGDVIIGLPSTGVHSNGYSLVRKVIGVDGIVPSTPRPRLKAELESELARSVPGRRPAPRPGPHLREAHPRAAPRGHPSAPLPASPVAASPRTSTAPCPPTSKHSWTTQDGLGYSRRHYLCVRERRAHAQRGLQASFNIVIYNHLQTSRRDRASSPWVRSRSTVGTCIGEAPAR